MAYGGTMMTEDRARRAARGYVYAVFDRYGKWQCFNRVPPAQIGWEPHCEPWSHATVYKVAYFDDAVRHFVFYHEPGVAIALRPATRLYDERGGYRSTVQELTDALSAMDALAGGA